MNLLARLAELLDGTVTLITERVKNGWTLHLEGKRGPEKEWLVSERCMILDEQVENGRAWQGAMQLMGRSLHEKILSYYSNDPGVQERQERQAKQDREAREAAFKEAASK